MKKPLSFRLNAAYDVHTGSLESINSDLNAEISGITFSAGQRYEKAADIKTYVAGLGIHPLKPLYLWEGYGTMLRKKKQKNFH